jgi:hypothetical protein
LSGFDCSRNFGAGFRRSSEELHVSYWLRVPLRAEPCDVVTTRRPPMHLNRAVRDRFLLCEHSHWRFERGHSKFFWSLCGAAGRSRCRAACGVPRVTRRHRGRGWCPGSARCIFHICCAALISMRGEQRRRVSRFPVSLCPQLCNNCAPGTQTLSGQATLHHHSTPT